VREGDHRLDSIVGDSGVHGAELAPTLDEPTPAQQSKVLETFGCGAAISSTSSPTERSPSESSSRMRSRVGSPRPRKYLATMRPAAWGAGMGLFGLLPYLVSFLTRRGKRASPRRAQTSAPRASGPRHRRVGRPEAHELVHRHSALDRQHRTLDHIERAAATMLRADQPPPAASATSLNTPRVSPLTSARRTASSGRREFRPRSRARAPRSRSGRPGRARGW
jgi:hypothetical protein